MITIKYTDNKSYIRITHPTATKHNLGYISPSDGQLSVKPELMDIIKNANLDTMFIWKKGKGRHDGSGYEAHTTNHNSVACTINFIERVILLNEEKLDINIL